MDEPTVTGSDLFEIDPNLPIEEMPDGSAVIEIEETMTSDEEDFNDNLAEYIDKQERSEEHTSELQSH